MAETTSKAGASGSRSNAVDYELHYFEGIRGGAQPIRWILIDANANWNEKLVPYDQWESKYKADESFSGMFRTLPVLLVNATNTRISQLLTIISYLGRKLNYYGTDTSPEGIARCDSICSAAVLDVALPLTKFMHVFARFPDMQFASLYEEFIPKVENVLKRLDYLLGDNNFLCGNKISTADLVVFEAFEVALIVFGPILAAKYPRLDKLHDRIRDRPNIKAWRTSGNMARDITISTKYKEFLRLVRDRFNADNSSLEASSAAGKKKLDEVKQLGKLRGRGGVGGVGQGDTAMKEKLKQKDVGGVGEQKSFGEGEGMMGKQKGGIGKQQGGVGKQQGGAGKQQEGISKQQEGVGKLQEGAAGKAGVGVPLKTGVHKQK